MQDSDNPWLFFVRAFSKLHTIIIAIMLAIATLVSFYIQYFVPPEQREGFLARHWPSLPWVLLISVIVLGAIAAYSFVAEYKRHRLDERQKAITEYKDGLLFGSLERILQNRSNNQFSIEEIKELAAQVELAIRPASVIAEPPKESPPVPEIQFMSAQAGRLPGGGSVCTYATIIFRNTGPIIIPQVKARIEYYNSQDRLLDDIHCGQWSSHVGLPIIPVFEVRMIGQLLIAWRITDPKSGYATFMANGNQDRLFLSEVGDVLRIAVTIVGGNPQQVLQERDFRLTLRPDFDIRPWEADPPIFEPEPLPAPILQQ